MDGDGKGRRGLGGVGWERGEEGVEGGGGSVFCCFNDDDDDMMKGRR